MKKRLARSLLSRVDEIPNLRGLPPSWATISTNQGAWQENASLSPPSYSMRPTSSFHKRAQIKRLETSESFASPWLGEDGSLVWASESQRRGLLFSIQRSWATSTHISSANYLDSLTANASRRHSASGKSSCLPR